MYGNVHFIPVRPSWSVPQSPGPFQPAPYFRYPPPEKGAICMEHFEMSQRMSKVEQELETVGNHIKSLFNFLAEQQLNKGGVQQVLEAPVEPSSSPAPRKRKAKPVVNGDAKKAKMITDLEQKLANDRERNAKMEVRIADLRTQLAELKERRIQKEKEQELRQQSRIDVPVE